jgi:hypothetical protein
MLAIEPPRQVCGRRLKTRPGQCTARPDFEADGLVSSCKLHRTREEWAFVRRMCEARRPVAKVPMCWFWPMPEVVEEVAVLALEDFQKDRCAICGTTTTHLKDDVDPGTGVLRGLLCRSCVRGSHQFATSRCVRLYLKRPATAVIGHWGKFGGQEGFGRLQGMVTDSPPIATREGTVLLPRLRTTDIDTGEEFWASTREEFTALCERIDRRLEARTKWDEEQSKHWPEQVQPANTRMVQPPSGCPKREGLGYIYVVEFSTGVVKVGLSTDPVQRWGNYRYDVTALGVWITRMWVSRAHRNVDKAERELISLCAARGRPTRAEYFHGVRFEDAVAYGEKLPDWADAIDPASPTNR